MQCILRVCSHEPEHEHGRILDFVTNHLHCTISHINRSMINIGMLVAIRISVEHNCIVNAAISVLFFVSLCVSLKCYMHLKIFNLPYDRIHTFSDRI
jgi:hypothetical protein